MSNQDNALRLESDEMIDKCLAMASLGLIHSDLNALNFFYFMTMCSQRSF